MGSRPCLHGGQALRRHSRGDLSTRPRGHGGDDFPPILALPPSRGKGGVGSRPCLHEVRLCAGIHEGMCPRIREDTGVGSHPCLHEVRLCAGIHEGMCPRIREDTGGGKDFTPILAFPPQGGRKKRGDGSPSLSSRGQALRRHSRGDGSTRPRGHGGRLCAGIHEGMGSRPCLHGGRLCAGIHEGICPRVREDTGGEDFTPILAFPPQGGRNKRGAEVGGAASSGGFLRR